MCVVFFTRQHPEYALILCSNRDEYLARPTEPACFHSLREHPQDVLSGIDAKAGGTWLGLARTGKLALLTNITEPPATTFAFSRGRLVSSFLATPPDAHPLEAHVPPDAPYAGFNLVLFAPTPAAERLAYDARLVTNHGAGGPITHRALSDQPNHAVSNGTDGVDADDLPKVQHGLDAFTRLLDALPPNTPAETLAERLFDLLTWRSAQPPRERSELKNTIQVDPIFIDGVRYATRLSTVVLISRTGHVLFIERDRWEGVQNPALAPPASQRVFRFSLTCKSVADGVDGHVCIA